MAKQKHKTEIQPESIPEVNLSENEQAAFELLDDLFHTNEDSYNEHQDNSLLVLIENENAINDKLKIKYLFKKYRDEARNNHGL